jgi:hypothetical protein
MKDRFHLKRLPLHKGKARPDDATSITTMSFDDAGNRLGMVMITMFSGPNAGRAEAKRMCDLLNKACADFYDGKSAS